MLGLCGFMAAAVSVSGCTLMSQPKPPGTGLYRISANETLLDVAQRNHLGSVELVAANPGVDPWVPKPGTEIVIPKTHLPPQTGAKGERIIINSAADWGVSDSLKVPKTVRAMVEAGGTDQGEATVY